MPSSWRSSAATIFGAERARAAASVKSPTRFHVKRTLASEEANEIEGKP